MVRIHRKERESHLHNRYGITLYEIALAVTGEGYFVPKNFSSLRLGDRLNREECFAPIYDPPFGRIRTGDNTLLLYIKAPKRRKLLLDVAARTVDTILIGYPYYDVYSGILP